jgi:hypothetical protein
MPPLCALVSVWLCYLSPYSSAFLPCRRCLLLPTDGKATQFELSTTWFVTSDAKHTFLL